MRIRYIRFELGGLCFYYLLEFQMDSKHFLMDFQGGFGAVDKGRLMMELLTRNNHARRRSNMVYVTSTFIFMLVVVFSVVEYDQTLELVVSSARSEKLVFSKDNKSTTGFSRKLMDSDSADEGDMNRIGATTCSKGDIVIFQGPTPPLPNGIPTYTVQVLNVCVSGCSISNIHLSCGWFSSARLINPSLFRRICYDDCLVNDGDALGPGESLSFQYANSFQYPLSVSSVAC